MEGREDWKRTVASLGRQVLGSQAEKLAQIDAGIGCKHDRQSYGCLVDWQNATSVCDYMGQTGRINQIP